MQRTTDSMASRMADQLAMFLNFSAKILAYEPILPLTNDQTKRIQLICNEFIAIYNYVEQCQATTKSLAEWRDLCWKGSPVNDPASARPTYPTYAAVAQSFIGILIKFRELREIIVSSPGYTLAIGEDLMIVGTPQENALPQNTAPSLKVVTSNNYGVRLSGSMQGMDAMRVEYYRKVPLILHRDASILPKAPVFLRRRHLFFPRLQLNQPTLSHIPSLCVSASLRESSDGLENRFPQSREGAKVGGIIKIIYVNLLQNTSKIVKSEEK